MSDYVEIPQLADFVLEESWVVGVVARPGTLDIRLDLVFAETHPGLRRPRSGEQFYSLPGQIRFRGVTSLSWTDQGMQPATDANGEMDWGHIDSLTFDGSQYELIGGFGAISLNATSLDVDVNGED